MRPRIPPRAASSFFSCGPTVGCSRHSRKVDQLGGIVVLPGNLAPRRCDHETRGCLPHLIQHRGRALVFDSIEDCHTRIDDPALDVMRILSWW
jgi:dihydroxyacid dehydratase/phosphogluconate dehydratase